MADKQKSAIWVAIFIFAAYFAFTLAGKSIFPHHQIAKVQEWRVVSGVNTPYDEYGRAIKKLYEPNSWDAVIKVGLVLVAVIAYWNVLGMIIPTAGLRLLAFIVSLPIAAYITFALLLAKGLHAI